MIDQINQVTEYMYTIYHGYTIYTCLGTFVEISS